MKKLIIIPVLILFSCTGNEANQPVPSPGVLENTQEVNTADTNHLVTDSVVIKDSNTADIEPIKKIN